MSASMYHAPLLNAGLPRALIDAATLRAEPGRLAPHVYQPISHYGGVAETSLKLLNGLLHGPVSVGAAVAVVANGGLELFTIARLHGGAEARTAAEECLEVLLAHQSLP